MQLIISQCFLILLSNWVYYFSSLTCKAINTMLQKDLLYSVMQEHYSIGKAFENSYCHNNQTISQEGCFLTISMA